MGSTDCRFDELDRTIIHNFYIQVMERLFGRYRNRWMQSLEWRTPTVDQCHVVIARQRCGCLGPDQARTYHEDSLTRQDNVPEEGFKAGRVGILVGCVAPWEGGPCRFEASSPDEQLKLNCP
jgi:hypothetical protein